MSISVDDLAQPRVRLDRCCPHRSSSPATASALHEQALHRLRELTGLIPVEYPTTRELGASPEARAADVNEAFADPDVRAILATIGVVDGRTRTVSAAY
jgi:hypothetical protein